MVAEAPSHHPTARASKCPAPPRWSGSPAWPWDGSARPPRSVIKADQSSVSVAIKRLASRRLVARHAVGDGFPSRRISGPSSAVDRTGAGQRRISFGHMAAAYSKKSDALRWRLVPVNSIRRSAFVSPFTSACTKVFSPLSYQVTLFAARADRPRRDRAANRRRTRCPRRA